MLQMNSDHASLSYSGRETISIQQNPPASDIHQVCPDTDEDTERQTSPHAMVEIDASRYCNIYLTHFMLQSDDSNQSITRTDRTRKPSPPKRHSSGNYRPFDLNLVT